MMYVPQGKKRRDGKIDKKKIEKLIRQVLLELGENPDREGLIGTPHRIAEMYEEIFGGYNMNAQLDISFMNKAMQLSQKISSFSACVNTICCLFMEE